jgi:beta-mannanase
MIVLTLHGYTLDDINSGKFDSNLQTIADQVKGSEEIWFRLLHEANSDWYTYGIYSPGNSAEKFTAAFDRMAAILRSAGSNVHIQLGLNNKSPHDMDAQEAKPFQ